MNARAFAVLIGINSYTDKTYLPPLRYAEKDCRDFADALADTGGGIFSPNNVKVVLGSEATTRNIETQLHSFVVKQSADLVLVYFSGHGFLTGDPQEGYLGTSDVSTTELLKNPNAGLRMRYLHEEVFLKSSAENIIFILDCCHSGSLVPAHVRTSITQSPSRGLLDAKYYTKGRIAICSCPPDAVSRESEQLQNGVFTHFLLKGLKGEAVEAATGQVTVDSLLAYVKIHTPPDQTPGRYGHDFGRIILAHPRTSFAPVKIGLPDVALSTVEATPLTNPLEYYSQFIRNLIGHLSDNQPSEIDDVERQVLEAVRKATEADVVFLLHRDRDSWIVKSQSSFGPRGKNRHGYIDTLIARILPNILNKSLFGSAHQGVYYAFKDPDGVESAVVVAQPDAGSTNEFIFVCGLRGDSHLVGVAFGRILAALYRASRGLTLAQPDYLEAAILDDLRLGFRFVPLSAYDRRFELFKRRLRDMIIHFQPVLRLGPGAMEFESWEALARDPLALTAPGDLFHAAELWGRQFTTELDIHLVKLATQCYRDAYKDAGGQHGELKELSVNVYPESLMRTAYYQTIADIITRDKILPARKLTLEISEKTPLPSSEQDDKRGLITFKDQLRRFSREFEVGFAIDDFGVGYASPSRLAGLNPAYVKIDRDVLLNEFGELTIKYVIEVAETGLRPQRVVVEGVDEASGITLGRLYEVGVRRVQGFLIGRPSPSIYPLDTNLEEYLAKLTAKSFSAAKPRPRAVDRPPL
jgi:EAL domain-containing protein (putative c-di-GMP-specific phosphodiesterase class I)